MLCCARNVYTLVLSLVLDTPYIYPVFCIGGQENQRPENGWFAEMRGHLIGVRHLLP